LRIVTRVTSHSIVYLLTEKSNSKKSFIAVISNGYA